MADRLMKNAPNVLGDVLLICLGGAIPQRDDVKWTRCEYYYQIDWIAPPFSILLLPDPHSSCSLRVLGCSLLLSSAT